MNNEHTQETEHFQYAGYDCKIIHHEFGHWCGYVKRPEAVEPVRWRSDYDNKHDKLHEAEIDVHGGITYGPDEDGFVGFDDAHATKLTEKHDLDSAKEAVKKETEQLAVQIYELQHDGERIS